MARGTLLRNALVGATAVLFTGARFAPALNGSGPVLSSAIAFVNGRLPAADSASALKAADLLASRTEAAVQALASAVHPVSHPQALVDAFRSYFAFRSAHPDEVRKPYLYFVDYGLPSTTPRGYVFDMDSLRIVDGPFTVAHGRGSSASQYGVPTKFSNAFGSNATSLGLYLAEGLYDFHGRWAGHPYGSIGMQLVGVSGDFNDNALARRVVAHGAPYVTPTRAGRSEGCPAMEPARAKELLPKLADGGMVFLFAPDSQWISNDPWVSAE